MVVLSRQHDRGKLQLSALHHHLRAEHGRSQCVHHFSRYAAFLPFQKVTDGPTQPFLVVALAAEFAQQLRWNDFKIFHSRLRQSS